MKAKAMKKTLSCILALTLTASMMSESLTSFAALDETTAQTTDAPKAPETSEEDAEADAPEAPEEDETNFTNINTGTVSTVVLATASGTTPTIYNDDTYEEVIAKLKLSKGYKVSVTYTDAQYNDADANKTFADLGDDITISLYGEASDAASTSFGDGNLIDSEPKWEAAMTAGKKKYS